MDKRKKQMENVAIGMKVERAREKAKPLLRQYQRAKLAVGNRVSEHTENMAFYEGKQYSLAKYKSSRPWVVRMRTPYASNSIDTRVSSMIANDYFGELIPMTPEDDEPIKILSSFMADEWERMNMNTLIDESIKTSSIVRESYVHLVWVDEPYGKGATARDGYTEAYAIDIPASVYIDPSALKMQDARYISILSRKSLDEAQEEYPEYADYIRPNAGGMSPEDRGESFIGKDYLIEQDDVCTIVTHYVKKDGIITKYVIVEDILVQETELDGLTMFPIAQMRWKRASGNCYGLSLMDELIDLQKAINTIESAITNTAVAYSAPSYGVKKGVGIDPKDLSIALGAPGMVIAIEGDIAQAIKALDMPKLDNAIIDIKQDYAQEISKISGITSPFLGSVGTTGNTAQGAQMSMERARIIENEVLHNVTLFVEELTAILFQYISANYSGSSITTRHVDKSTGKVEFDSKKIPDKLEDLKYSFYVNLSNRTAYSKEREKDAILQLYQMEHQYKDEIKMINQMDVLESFDLSNRDVLVERFNRMTQQSNANKTQIIMQLMTDGTKLGLTNEQMQPAILELLSGVPDTPLLNALTAQMKQMAQVQTQMREKAMGELRETATQAGVSGVALDNMMGANSQQIMPDPNSQPSPVDMMNQQAPSAEPAQPAT